MHPILQLDFAIRRNRGMLTTGWTGQSDPKRAPAAEPPKTVAVAPLSANTRVMFRNVDRNALPRREARPPSPTVR